MADLARAVEHLLPEALYHDASSYARLMATWFDPRAIPSEAELQTASDEVDAADTAAAQREATTAATRAAAKTNAAAIPSWATWDEAEVQAWIDGKFDQTTVDAISDLASAKAVIGDMATALRAMARMVIALRDAQWPDLGG